MPSYRDKGEKHKNQEEPPSERFLEHGQSESGGTVHDDWASGIMLYSFMLCCIQLVWSALHSVAVTIGHET